MIDKNKIGKILNNSLIYKNQNKLLYDFIAENEDEYKSLSFNTGEKIVLFTILIKSFSADIEGTKCSLVNVDLDFIGDNASWQEIERRLEQSKKSKIANRILESLNSLIDEYEKL